MSAAAALGSLDFDVELHEARPFLGRSSYLLSPAAGGGRFRAHRQLPTRAAALLYQLVGLLPALRGGEEDSLRRPAVFCSPGGQDRHPPAGLSAGAISPFQLANWVWRPRRPRQVVASFERSPPCGASVIEQTSTGLRWDNGSPRKAPRNALASVFWRPILVSALNEEPERASAAPAFQVFLDGLMATRDSFEMGVPAVPLADLYSAALEQKLASGVRIRLRSTVERIDPADRQGDFYISAVPFERVKRFGSGTRSAPRAFRTFADHGHPPLVRPSDYRPPPRGAPRRHAAVAIPQIGELFSGRGQRVTLPVAVGANGHRRDGVSRAARVFSPSRRMLN